MNDAANRLAQAIRDVINEAVKQRSSGTAQHHHLNELLNVPWWCEGLKLPIFQYTLRAGITHKLAQSARRAQ